MNVHKAIWIRLVTGDWCGIMRQVQTGQQLHDTTGIGPRTFPLWWSYFGAFTVRWKPLEFTLGRLKICDFGSTQRDPTEPIDLNQAELTSWQHKALKPC